MENNFLIEFLLLQFFLVNAVFTSSVFFDITGTFHLRSKLYFMEMMLVFLWEVAISYMNDKNFTL